MSSRVRASVSVIRKPIRGRPKDALLITELGAEIAVLAGDLYTMSQVRLLSPTIAKRIDDDRRWKKIKLMIFYNDKIRLRDSIYYRRFFHIDPIRHITDVYDPLRYITNLFEASRDRQRVARFVAQWMSDNDTVLNAPPIPSHCHTEIYNYLPKHLVGRLAMCRYRQATKEDLKRWHLDIWNTPLRPLRRQDLLIVIEDNRGTTTSVEPLNCSTDLMLFAEDDDGEDWYYTARNNVMEYKKKNAILLTDVFIMTDEELEERKGRVFIPSPTLSTMCRTSHILPRAISYLVPYTHTAIESMYAVGLQQLRQIQQASGTGKNRNSDSKSSLEYSIKMNCLNKFKDVLTQHLLE